MVWWVRSDPCGLFSANLTIALILYAQFVIIKILVLPWFGFGIHVLLYTCCSILAILSHTRAQFSDPGSVPKNHTSQTYPYASIETLEQAALSSITEPPSSSPSSPSSPSSSSISLNNASQVPRTCKRCKAVKPFRAHHCSTCGRCVIKMDHHCPWVNNCVAVFNQKYFILFLFYTCLCCVYSAVLLVGRFISCTNSVKTCSVTGIGAALCVLNFIEALIFGLFVCIMMFDQFSAIFDNTPGVDALQNKHGPKRSRYQSLKEVFGEPFSWRWFLPLSIPKQIHEDFQFELQQEELLNAHVPLSSLAGRESPKEM